MIAQGNRNGFAGLCLVRITAFVAILGAAACSSSPDAPTVARPSPSSSAAAPDAPSSGPSSAPSDTPSGAPSSGSPAGPPATGAPGVEPTPSPAPARSGPPVRPRVTPTPAPVAPGVEVVLTEVRADTAQGRGAGVIAGSLAVRLALRLTNRGARPLNLDSTVVDLAVGPERLPASLVSDPPTKPFTGRLAPGASTAAVYVFSLPDVARGPSVVSVSAGAGLPTALLPLSV